MDGTIYFMCIGVNITKDPVIFVVGSPAFANCSNDLGGADSIDWIRTETKEVLASAKSMQHLLLPFDPVNDTIHGTTYMCHVTRSENGVNNRIISSKTLVVHVSGELLDVQFYSKLKKNFFYSSICGHFCFCEWHY